jgi:hypothetical protein
MTAAKKYTVIMLAGLGLLLNVPWAPAQPASRPAADKLYVDARYDFKFVPPADWKKGNLAEYRVPGTLCAAWTPDSTTSLTVFVQATGKAIPATELLDQRVKAAEQSGAEVRKQKVGTMGGREAMAVILVGKGTGGAMAANGDVSTAQQWVAYPREKDVVVFLLTTPEADLEKHAATFKAVLKTVELGPTPARRAQNLDFEAPAGPDGLPEGWLGWGGPADREHYELVPDKEVFFGGQHSGRLKCTSTAEACLEGFCGYGQSIDTDEYRGKRVRLNGWLRTQNVRRGWAGLWLRVDGPDGLELAFDNMQSSGRALRGTRDWKKYEVVLDVPAEAVAVVYGALLSGDGTAWVDDLSLETVDEKVPVTGKGSFGGKVAPIDRRILDDYVGKFRLDSGTVFEFVKEDDRLMVLQEGAPKIEIYPESDTTFFYKVVDAKFTFVRNAQGKVDRIILHQFGKKLPGKRID